MKAGVAAEAEAEAAGALSVGETVAMQDVWEVAAAAEAVQEVVAGLAAPSPSPLSARLLPFQQQGIAQMLSWGGRALLADEPGLGETLTLTPTSPP